MVDMYCEGHATCPFYKFWAENVETAAERHEPITVERYSDIKSHFCKAFAYCEGSTGEFSFGNDAIPEEGCSIIYMLNTLEGLIAAKAGKK